METCPAVSCVKNSLLCWSRFDLVAQRDLIDKTRQGNETKASERASSRPPVGISTPGKWNENMGKILTWMLTYKYFLSSQVAQSDLNKEMSNQQANPISIERVKITSKTITTVSKVENSSMERTKTTTKGKTIQKYAICNWNLSANGFIIF